MLSRRELKDLGIEMTDEQWNAFNKQMSDIQDRIWEEDHPLDN